MNLINRLKRARGKKHSDFIIITTVFLLVLGGLVMLASASSDLGKIRFGDSYYFIKHQILFGLLIGIIGFFIASNFYYRFYERWSLFLFTASILLVLLVFTPLGIQAGGAQRWINIDGFSFQPSELLKITVVIYLAAWLSRKKERINKFSKGALPFALIVGTVGYILLKQPSTSSAVILGAVALAIYFASGARLSYVGGLALIGILAVALLIYFTPYRWERVQSYLNPEKNPFSSAYHLNQTLIAIGSGGLWGTGYGQSTAKSKYLPEPAGDSIFAVIAEETGFIGAGVLIAAFLILITRIFYIAQKTKDQFGKLMLVGFGVLIAVQAFINIAAVSGVIPLTGVPLPFVSYGGTALAVFLTIAGIVNNVSRYN